MSREIKFRAWDKTLKEIIPVRNINFESKMININGAWRLFKEIELMQFTGKRDSKQTDEFPKGKEVFESDIIECEYYNGEVWRGVVVWGFGEPSFFVIRDNDNSKCYSVNFGGSAVKRWEVIGNIHQNHELLEVKL
jgi:uncharacterized phage protein (TIGR01671 family)